MAIKNSSPVVPALAILLAGAAPLEAADAHDLVARALAPLVRPLTADASARGGLDATLRLTRLDAGGADGRAVTLRILFEAPSHVMVDGSYDGHRMVVCRDGQAVWAAPGAVVRPLLDALDARGAARSVRLPDMVLPLNATEAALLPALLDVTDRGVETLDGVACRVVGVRLLDPLERSLGVAGWSATAWIEAEGARLARVEVAGPRWAGRLDVVALRAVTGFPDSVWDRRPDIDPVDVPTGVFADVLGRLLAQ